MHPSSGFFLCFLAIIPKYPDSANDEQGLADSSPSFGSSSSFLLFRRRKEAMTIAMITRKGALTICVAHAKLRNKKYCTKIMCICLSSMRSWSLILYKALNFKQVFYTKYKSLQQFHVYESHESTNISKQSHFLF